MSDSQNLKRNQEQQLSHSGHSDNLSAGNSNSQPLNSSPYSANTNQPVNSEYYQLSNQSNDSQQFHADNTPKSQQYDSSSQRQILHNMQQSFNEQRGQYTEQAFNDYEAQSPQQPQPQQAQQPQSAQQMTQPLQPQPQQHYDYEKASDAGEALPPEFQRLTDKIHQDREKQDKIYGKLDETKTKSLKTIYEKIVPDDDKRLKNPDKKKKHQKSRLYDKADAESAERLHEAVDDVLYGKGRMRHRQNKNSDEDEEEEKFSRVIKKEHRVGRLKFERRTTYEKLTRSEYDKNVKDRDKRNFKRRVKGRLLQDRAMSALDDDNIQEDDLSRDYKMALKRGYRMTDFYVRRKTKYLRDTYNPYARLQTLAQRERYHMDQQKRLKDNIDRKAQRDKLREAATKEERKRMKKEMQKQRMEKEGNFIRRTANQLKMTKRSVAYKQQMVKKTLKTLGVVCSIVGVFLPILIIVVLIVMGFTQGAAEYFGTAVVQVGYEDITDATEYYRNLEADLDEYLSDREALEDELQAEYGPDIYEFNYDLAEFGFSANTLVAYLAAKYGEFELNDDTKVELQEIFQEMYTLNIYTTMEEREIVDTSVTDANGNHPSHMELKKICYVKLIKKELEEVVEPRLTEDQLKQYKAYKLSTGGQQVYGPVMREDWSNKISSNFGDRIHPITGERKQHKGVDIAVPVGTKLYSAVKGTVTVARYSDSAGYMVTIQNDNGWTVTFMHMNNFVVSSGQKVQQGDFVGESGNTGNSTGPHLHLQVNDPSGNPINPIFIIPQTCVVISTDEAE